MKFNKTSLMGLSYFFGAAFTIYRVYLKIMHIEDINNLMIVGSMVLLVFSITAIIELFKVKKINPFERGIWFTGLLFLPVITGFFYLTKQRQRFFS